MTVRPATSTPRPLPRRREPMEKRPWLPLTGAIANQTVNDNGSAQLKQTQKGG